VMIGDSPRVPVHARPYIRIAFRGIAERDLRYALAGWASRAWRFWLRKRPTPP
jgi:hypothetical protein